MCFFGLDVASFFDGGRYLRPLFSVVVVYLPSLCVLYFVFSWPAYIASSTM